MRHHLPEYAPFPNETSRNWRQEYIEIPVMLVALGIPRGGRVLEVGCGRGIALPLLARRLVPARLVRLDIDAALLSEARAHLDQAGATAELLPGDVRALPFSAAAFDVVVDFGTCFHISQPARALREIARVLSPGGMFITETKLSQLLSHPVRARGRRLPWAAVPELEPLRHALLWESRRRELSGPSCSRLT